MRCLRICPKLPQPRPRLRPLKTLTKAMAANGRRSDPMRMSTLKDIGDCRRLVVKIGSSLLVERGESRKAWPASLVRELAGLRAPALDLGTVRSGGIAFGAARRGR